jgi:hypothetical protein
MRIFSRRARNDDYDRYNRNDDGDGTTGTASTTPPSTAIRRAYPDQPARATTTGETAQTTAPADDGRRWHHGPTRGIVTLLAAAVAGLLAWTTTTISDNTTGGYWAAYGILAAAGLVMALSQLVGGWTKWGRPTFSPTVFLLAFVPTAIAVGWIFLFHQPHSTLWRGDVMNWSGDLGIAGVVKDMGGDLLTMLAFGLGLLFGFCFDTTPALRRRGTPAPATARRMPADTDADEALGRERARGGEVVRS